VSLINRPLGTQKTRTLTQGIQFGNGVKRPIESMVIKGKGKGKGKCKVHPLRGHEGPKGGRGIGLLIL